MLADAVVFASHYPIMNTPGYYFARMHQERSYVLALKQAQPFEHLYLGVDPGKTSPSGISESSHCLEEKGTGPGKMRPEGNTRSWRGGQKNIGEIVRR